MLVILGYLLLITVRIVLTWFSGPRLGRAWDLLHGITEPYLSQFYRLKFLRKDMLDFTPIAAILVLVILLDLLNALISYGTITLGYFLASVLSAIWSGASFLLLLFLVVGLLRTVGLLLESRTGSAFWKVVDLLIQPVIAFVMRYISPRSSLGYTQYLIITVLLLFASWFLGGVMVRGFVRVLISLPL